MTADLRPDRPAVRSAPRPSRFPGPSGRRSGDRIARTATVMAAFALVGCGASAQDDAALPPLLTVGQLGEGWVASDPGEVARLPGSVAPPCPFDGDIPDIDVVAAESIEFGDEARRLGINHTVVTLDDDASARAVLGTWAAMDCTGSDAVQRSVRGLPDGVVGVELDTIGSEFTQTVLVRVIGSAMSFLVVTGEGDLVVELTRRLATQF